MVDMVENVPTRWGERGDKGGRIKCLDFGEIEQSFLNITATAYLFDWEVKMAFENQLDLYLAIWSIECLWMILNSQNATKHKNHKQFWGKFKVKIKQTHKQPTQPNNNQSMIIPLTWNQYDSANNSFFILSGVTCLSLREISSSLLIKLFVAACDELIWSNCAAFQQPCSNTGLSDTLPTPLSKLSDFPDLDERNIFHGPKRVNRMIIRQHKD